MRIQNVNIDNISNKPAFGITYICDNVMLETISIFWWQNQFVSKICVRLMPYRVDKVKTVNNLSNLNVRHQHQSSPSWNR